MKERSWIYQTFICGHWYSGQIKSEGKTRNYYRGGRKVRHFRECQKCGKKVYVD